MSSKFAIFRIAAVLQDEAGASAIEYGLVAALVAVFILGAVGSLGNTLVGIFDTTARAFPS